jgi:hypothetical protein
METWFPTSDYNRVIALKSIFSVLNIGLNITCPNSCYLCICGLLIAYPYWIRGLNLNARKWWNECWNDEHRSSIQDPNMSCTNWIRSCFCAWPTAYLCLISVTRAKGWNACIKAQYLNLFISILPYSRFGINNNPVRRRCFLCMFLVFQNELPRASSYAKTSVVIM